MKKLISFFIFCLFVLVIIQLAYSDEPDYLSFDCIVPSIIPTDVEAGCHINTICPNSENLCKDLENRLIEVCQSFKSEFKGFTGKDIEGCFETMTELSSDLEKPGSPCEVENPKACEKATKAYEGFDGIREEYGDYFDPKTDGIQIYNDALTLEEAIIWPEFGCETDADCAPICSDSKVTETKCINGVCTAGQKTGCWIECGAECEMPRKGCKAGRVCNPLTCSCINI